MRIHRSEWTPASQDRCGNDPALLDRQFRRHIKQKHFRDALDAPMLKGICLVLLAGACCLEREAVWFEGCDCQQHILDGRIVPWRVRMSNWRQATWDCKFKGCGYFQCWVDVCRKCLLVFKDVWINELKEYVKVCSPEIRVNLLAFKRTLDSRLYARFCKKFDYIFDSPCIFCRSAPRADDGQTFGRQWARGSQEDDRRWNVVVAGPAPS